MTGDNRTVRNGSIRLAGSLTVAAFGCSLAFMLISASPGFADENLARALKAVREVDVNGAGQEAAVEAMRVVNAASLEQVPEILKGMDGANRLATNWLRCAVVSIVNRGGEPPRKAIEDYFSDTNHSHFGRLLAFELLTNGDPELARRIVPDLIDDPSLPLRSKAISAFIEKANTATDPIEKAGILAVALDKARDTTQVQQIAKMLSDNGVSVDLSKQFGFLDTWHLVGSFDNKDQNGFNVAYGPEKKLGSIELKASYDDSLEEPATWSRHTTGHETGVVDLNEAIGKVKGATVYAYTVFDANESCLAEFRIGTPNATKIWLNGELVMENEVYHNSNSIDKFAAKVKLKKGENQILIKVCQNEQTEQWAQDWEFQLRICDETGKAIQPAASQPTQ